MFPINKDKKPISSTQENEPSQRVEKNEGMIAGASAIRTNAGENIQTNQLIINVKETNKQISELRDAFKKNNISSIQSLFNNNAKLVNIILKIPLKNSQLFESEKDALQTYTQVLGGLYHYALQRCTTDVLSLFHLLNENKCDINSVDSLGRTALHIAIQSGNEEIITFLFENMNTSAILKQSKAGQHLLHLAAMHTNSKIFELTLASLTIRYTQEQISKLLSKENNDNHLCLEYINLKDENIQKYIEETYRHIEDVLPFLSDNVLLGSLKNALNCGLLSYFSEETGNLFHLCAKNGYRLAFNYFYTELEKHITFPEDVENVLNQINTEGIPLLHLACAYPSMLNMMVEGEFGSKIHAHLDVKSKKGETALIFATRRVLEINADLDDTNKYDKKNQINNLNASIYSLLRTGANKDDISTKYMQYIIDSEKDDKKEQNEIRHFLTDLNVSSILLLQHARHLILNYCIPALTRFLVLQPEMSDFEIEIIKEGRKRKIKDYLKDKTGMHLMMDTLRSVLKSNDHLQLDSLLNKNPALIEIIFKYPFDIKRNEFKDINPEKLMINETGLFHYYIQRYQAIKPETIHILLSHNVEINYLDSLGRTFLHLAAIKEEEAVISMILENINPELILSPMNNGKTALHIAAINGNLQAIKCIFSFLNKNENKDTGNIKRYLNEKDADGHSFMHYLETNTQFKKEHGSEMTIISEFME